MSAQPEEYIPCAGLICHLNGVVMTIKKGGFTPDFGVDEMTNAVDGGAYSDVKTTTKTTGKMEVAYKVGGTGLGLVNGGIYRMLINCTEVVTAGPPITYADTAINADVPYAAGFVRVKFGYDAYLDVDKGVVANIEFTSQGAFVVGGI